MNLPDNLLNANWSLFLSLLGNYHFLLSSLLFDFIIQNGHQTPELFAVNITGVKVLDLDFLNETKYSVSNSSVTILESNGSNRLSKNVTARRLNQEETDQLTAVLLAWSKAGDARPSSVHRSINNSQPSGHSTNIADISVMCLLIYFIWLCSS